MKKIFGVLFFLLLIGIALVFVWINEHQYQQSFVGVNGYRVNVDEARTSNQKEKGLGGRKSLSENQGMIFIYSEEEPLSFWMKGMLIPIDIIWLDQHCKVVFIEKDLSPCPSTGECPVYTSPVNAQFVLETAAGFSDRHHIVTGKTFITTSACSS